VTFVLTNQNHTQTISSRADNKHLKYWVAEDLPADPEAAIDSAAEYPGTWIDHWLAWLDARSTEKVDAAQGLGSSKYPVLGDAPGQYVLES
jgi:polyhydroxyalkanoate synthase